MDFTSSSKKRKRLNKSLKKKRNLQTISCFLRSKVHLNDKKTSYP